MRIRENRSILDLVSQDLKRLMRSVGESDRCQTRSVFRCGSECRAADPGGRAAALAGTDGHGEADWHPDLFSDYARLMLDLQVLAFQGDLTRVGTFMVDTRWVVEPIPASFGDQHHSLTHHQGDTAKIEKVIQINVFHARRTQYFLEKMRSVPDGDGSLLDHSLLAYGSPLSDAAICTYKDLPVLLVAGGATGIEGDRHVRLQKNTPIANLYLTLLDTLGIHLERFGDSTGRIDL